MLVFAAPVVAIFAVARRSLVHAALGLTIKSGNLSGRVEAAFTRYGWSFSNNGALNPIYNTDGATDANGGSSADGPDAAGDDGAPTTACASTKALYAFGGIQPAFDGGALDNAPPILAAPICADGTLGAWTALTASLPFHMSRGAAASPCRQGLISTTCGS